MPTPAFLTAGQGPGSVRGRGQGHRLGQVARLQRPAGHPHPAGRLARQAPDDRDFPHAHPYHAGRQLADLPHARRPPGRAAPVERLALTVNLHTKEPLRTVFSPTHDATITRKGLTEATATVRADHWSGLDDFRLFWVADKDDLGLRVLAHRGAGKEDGFFMLLGNPTGAAAEKVVEKDVIFVLDTSGSMRGEKIEQARSAIDYCLEHLNRGDRFNVITFGTAVKSFRDDLVAAAPANLTAAREFVENVVANGQTNISGALEKALAGKADAGRPRIMIFLTDGAPTVGELIPGKDHRAGQEDEHQRHQDLRHGRRQRRQRPPARPARRGDRRLQRIRRPARKNSTPRSPPSTIACRIRCCPA